MTVRITTGRRAIGRLKTGRHVTGRRRNGRHAKNRRRIARPVTVRARRGTVRRLISGRPADGNGAAASNSGVTEYGRGCRIKSTASFLHT